MYFDAALTNELPTAQSDNSIKKSAPGSLTVSVYYIDNRHTDVSTAINTGGVALYVKAYLQQSPTRTAVGDPWTVRIYPDCSQETVTVTSTQTTLSDYILNTGQTIYTLPTMATSLDFCTLSYKVKINGTLITSDATLSSLFGFTSSNQQFTVDISNNYYGN